MAKTNETKAHVRSLCFAHFFLSLLWINLLLQWFKHFFHGILVPIFNMFDSPHFPEPTLPNDILIIEAFLIHFAINRLFVFEIVFFELDNISDTFFRPHKGNRLMPDIIVHFVASSFLFLLGAHLAVVFAFDASSIALTVVDAVIAVATDTITTCHHLTFLSLGSWLIVLFGQNRTNCWVLLAQGGFKEHPIIRRFHQLISNYWY